MSVVPPVALDGSWPSVAHGVDEVQAAAARRPSGSRPRSRSWRERYALRLLLTDIVAVLWGAAGVHLVHLDFMTSTFSRDITNTRYIGVTVLVSVAWLVALDWWGSRDGKVIGHGPEEFKRIINASFALFGALAIAAYLLNLDVPRSYLVIMMPGGLVALLVGRYIDRRWLHRERDRGQMMTDLVAVGSAVSVGGLIDDLRRTPFAGYRVVGVCLNSLPESVEPPGRTFKDLPILGGYEDVAGVARRVGAHAVAVAATDTFGPAAVRRLGWELDDSDVDLILAPALTNVAGPRVHTQPVAGLPLIHVERPTYQGANRILKKTFDIAGAAVLLILFALPLLVLAVIIKVSDRGPIFFRQERVGLNGKSFKMIKFRSMVTNAEELLADLRKNGHDAGNEVMYKNKNDPRITRVGKFLRKYSLDELPQLFNVVRSEMSLVGPRPPLQAEVDVYGHDALLRLKVKPGMTGLWQVSGRSNLTWEETVRLDVYYVENWSITGDLVILWKTAKEVVSSSSAY